MRVKGELSKPITALYYNHGGTLGAVVDGLMPGACCLPITAAGQPYFSLLLWLYSNIDTPDLLCSFTPVCRLSP